MQIKNSSLFPKFWNWIVLFVGHNFLNIKATEMGQNRGKRLFKGFPDLLYFFRFNQKIHEKCMESCLDIYEQDSRWIFHLKKTGTNFIPNPFRKWASSQNATHLKQNAAFYSKLHIFEMSPKNKPRYQFPELCQLLHLPPIWCINCQDYWCLPRMAHNYPIIFNPSIFKYKLRNFFNITIQRGCLWLVAHIQINAVHWSSWLAPWVCDILALTIVSR